MPSTAQECPPQEQDRQKFLLSWSLYSSGRGKEHKTNMRIIKCGRQYYREKQTKGSECTAVRTGGEESVVIEDLLEGKFELKTLWRRKSEPCGHLGEGHSRQRQLQVYSPGLSRKSQASIM